MPCLDPFVGDVYPPDSPEFLATAARAERAIHMINVYLDLHHVSRPDDSSGSVPTHWRPERLRTFELARVSGEMIHRLAQHCICDDLSFVELYNFGSVVTRPPYRAILLGMAMAIRSGAAYSPYQRQRYQDILEEVVASEANEPEGKGNFASGGVAEQARAALAPPGRKLDDPQLVSKDGPGLYAIYADPTVWEQLGLGAPPDGRPLYVGKAEESLIARDVRQHFRTGSTGSSTVRRSLAAFLRRPLNLRAQPRNPAKPDHFSSYSINPDGDIRLTEWMHANLRLALWIRPGNEELGPIEKALLQHWEPPLNGQGVKTKWSGLLSAVRKSMADEARAWKA